MLQNVKGGHARQPHGSSGCRSGGVCNSRGECEPGNEGGGWKSPDQILRADVVGARCWICVRRVWGGTRVYVKIES